MIASTALALLPGLAPAITAQEADLEVGSPLRPRWHPEKSLARALPPRHDPTRVIFKLADDAGSRSVGGRLVSGALDVSEIASIALDFGGTVERWIPLGDAELARMRRDGQRNTYRELADLSQLYRLDLPEGIDVAELLAALLERDVVETAYAAPLPAPSPGDVSPPTPSFLPNQTYRTASPMGIDADHVKLYGVHDGSSVSVVDIEYRWNLSHEDLTGVGPLALIGPAPVNPGFTATDWDKEEQHGTAALGVFAADDDATGMTGIASGASVRVAAAATSVGWNPAAAIALATANLKSGDVILLEQQAFGPTGTYPDLVPVEYQDAEFWAIAQATALGIHVVEAAGNGSQSLDNVAFPAWHPQTPQLPFQFATRDSGALVVGAVQSNLPHAKSPTSNEGARVDTHAWGNTVWTTGYGPKVNAPDLWLGAGCVDPFPAGASDIDQWYTGCYNGTSSASAILAGAVAVLAGKHVDSHSAPYSPYALRSLLRTTGTWNQNPTINPVGRMPDLRDQVDVVSSGRNAAHVFTGFDDGSHYGWAVCGAGDVDGDGHDDLAVGAPYHDSGVPGKGRMEVLSGLTGKTLWVTQGIVMNETLGYSIANVGDLNSDGVGELAVGSVGWNGSDGRVRVFNGINGATLFNFFAFSAGGLNGWAVAAAGDVDGDSVPDILVGEPAAFGYARVFSGSTGGVIHDLSGAGFDQYGWDVAGIGDVNGDSKSDLLVGAPMDDAAGVDAGKAYVVSGADKSVLKTFVGNAAGERFGWSVAAVGDLSGDSVPDFCIGTRDANGQTGRVTLYSGSDWSVLHDFLGEQPADQFGQSIASAGDFDADGVDDILVGANTYRIGAYGVGRAYVFSGATYAQLATYTSPIVTTHPGSLNFWQMGWDVAGAGDVDGDGRDDVIVSAHSAYDPSQSAGPGNIPGRAVVYLAPPRFAHTVATPGLVANLPSISAATGGAPWTGAPTTMTIQAGAAQAGKPYAILASVSGTSPGLPLGAVTLPLNFDVVTLQVLLASAGPPFSGFIGALDGGGNATATLGPFSAGQFANHVGLTIWFAGMTLDNLYVTNPVTVTIQP